MSRKETSRKTILDSAEAVVTEAGAAHLTLDAVAKKAGVSKGGLLHHFHSKAALLQSMLARLLERVDKDKADFRNELGDSRAVDLQAHVLAAFRKPPYRKQVAAALLAAGANDPKLLRPVQEWHARHHLEMAKTKRRPMRAAAIMLAVDGLWLNELLQVSPLNSRERRLLMQELLELAKSSA